MEEMEVWQDARRFCKSIGEMIDSGKLRRNQSLVDQIERSSGSVMDNIAEGFERSGNKEFIQHLHFSKASCAECLSQLYRALDRGYIGNEEFEKLYQEGKLLLMKIQKLINYLMKCEFKGPKFINR
ncbi:MAG TPA: four helix bundle protein [Flavisolibacter sp.]